MVVVKVDGLVQNVKIGDLIDKTLGTRFDGGSSEIAVGNIECLGVSPTEKVSWVPVTHFSRHPVNV